MNEPVRFSLPLLRMMDSLCACPGSNQADTPSTVGYSSFSVMLTWSLSLNKSAFMKPSAVKRS